MRKFAGWVQVGITLLLIAWFAARTAACSLCDPSGFSSPTLRQEAALSIAKLIVHGTIANPRTTGGPTGETDLHIKTILRDHPALKGKNTLVLPRFLPISDKEKPPHYLFFADVDDKGKIDPYRGILLRGPESVDYVKKSLALNTKDNAANLLFFFTYLNSPDPEIARDAFFEFAKANDADIARAAPKFDPVKLRCWLDDPNTPPMKLGVYALLLGACGRSEDIAYLRSLFDSKEPRYQNAIDGLLAGYMQQKPREGWQYIQKVLADEKLPLTLRLSVLRTIRFYQGAQPKESKDQVLQAMRTLLRQPDMADLAIEDLRGWKLWDLTPEILPLYQRKGYEAAILRRSIIRYALASPTTKETTAFLAARRKDSPEDVQEIAESLKYLEGMK